MALNTLGPPISGIPSAMGTQSFNGQPVTTSGTVSTTAGTSGCWAPLTANGVCYGGTISPGGGVYGIASPPQPVFEEYMRMLTNPQPTDEWNVSEYDRATASLTYGLLLLTESAKLKALALQPWLHDYARQLILQVLKERGDVPVINVESEQ